MAYDDLGVLEESGSFAAAGTSNSDGYDLVKGTPIFGMVARVVYEGLVNASGANSVTFSIDHSDDDATYYALSSGADQVVTLSTTAQSGEVFIPFRTNKRYVRLTCVVAGAGTSPAGTYVSHIGFSKP